MKFKAFTLAEVLITLGIIGVVAAMTLPGLISNRKNKELHTALKKTYSTLTQVLRFVANEEGQTPTPNMYNKEDLSIKLQFATAKYLNVAKDCQKQSCVPISTNKDEDGNILSERFIEQYKIYNKKRNVETNYFDDGQLLLRDGSLLMFENERYSPRLYITVDVNGPDKNPNTWGHDVFTFQLKEDGKLVPMGGNDSDYPYEQWCNKSSNDPLSGIGCTYPALTDKNYWKNL